MATMTLAKALKYRKRLVGDIAALDEQIKASNSVLAGNTPAVDVPQAMLKRSALVGHLVAVKTAITAANGPIQSLIYLAAEKKGLLALIKGLDTKDGRQVMGYAAEHAHAYAAQIKANDAAQMAKAVQDELDAVHEKLDAFNYGTEVVLPDLAE